MSRRVTVLVCWVAVVAGVLLASNAWWLRNNDLPDGFQNEYEHVYTLTEVFFRLRDGGLDEAWSPLWDGYYPPLMHVAGATGLATLGRSVATPANALGIFLVLLLGATAWTAYRLRGPEVAAVAVTLVATYPSVFGNARRYEPNIALSAMVALAAGLLIVRKGLDKGTTAALFGVLCGIGMLADRIVFVVYLLPLLVVAGVRAVRAYDAPRRTRALLRWTAAGAVAMLVCGYYYARFLAGHIDEVWTQLGGEITAAGEQSTALPWWTPTGLTYYPLSFVDSQMGFALATATAIGVSLYLLRGRESLDRDQAVLLDAWLFGGLLVITIVGKKQPYYAIPILAPAAIAAAVGWRALPDVRGRIAVAVVVAQPGFHQLAYLTKGSGLWPAPGRWAWFAGASPLPDGFLGHEYTQAAPPHQVGLNLPRIAELCAAQTAKAPDRPITAVFSEAQGAYEGQLMPALRLELDTLDVEGVLMNGHAIQEKAEEGAACFVYVTGSELTWPSRERIAQEWEDWGVGTPTEALYEAVDAMEARAYPLDRWFTERDEWVHVFTLVGPSTE